MKKLVLFFAVLLMLVGCNSRHECLTTDVKFLKSKNSEGIEVYLDDAPFSGRIWAPDASIMFRSVNDSLVYAVVYHENGDRAIQMYIPDMKMYYTPKGECISRDKFLVLYPGIDERMDSLYSKYLQVTEY